MQTRPGHLHLVAPEPKGDAQPAPGAGDLALLATLFLVNLVPVVGEVARPGSWGAGTVGLATACALVAGGELWLEVRALARARR